MNRSVENASCNENITLRRKHNHRKILSDVLNSSDDSFTIPPPLSERIKTSYTPVSETCPKKSDFNSSDDSFTLPPPLSERIKTSYFSASKICPKKSDFNSSDDSFTIPPPLSERIKTLYTPVSKTCLKKSDFNSDDSFTIPSPLSERTKTLYISDSKTHLEESDFNSLTSTDESDEEFNALLDRVKTPLRGHKTNALPSSLDENFKKFTTVEQKLRSLRISSPKTHVTPITYNPVTLPRHKKTIKNVFSSADINESFETKRLPNEKNIFNSERKRNYVTNKSPETPLKKEEKISFLESLSSKIPISDIHKDALPFRTNFKKTKDDLIKVLYKKYNDTVFSNKLPDDLSITWNTRMTKTAGFCYYHQIARTRYAKIELSTKVLDSADRVRDTLIHELCHAASWIMYGYRDGHGSIWNYLAKKANRLLPELPEITRCHYYDIMTKYVYKCTGCGGCIGRHSKSLDIKRKLCGRCGRTFELMTNRGSGYMVSTSKPVTGFARFVKENYGIVKEAHQGIKHAEIMKKLSIQFKSLDSLDTANN
ncbi:acidic repeat-containing protein-like isoform X2 [Centruroides sculpturatus]|uniref:acidic repeat-containing protein-like isoform X2 n=1 Tax=Centruroides sculpturatus TaxID=218467 RepID=UPI000C6D1B89|nr:acidic repeat-containing protein-like isoform X2 [Centruroides sculpturatus]